MPRGVERLRFKFTLTMAAYDLIRLPKLLGRRHDRWTVVRNAGEIGQIKRDHTPQPPTGNSKSGNVGDNFSGLLSCSLSRVQTRSLVSGFRRTQVKKQSDAHGRRQRLKTPVNKLSCAGWLPHDRVRLGLPRSRNERRQKPAHNRSRGLPAVALPPAVGAWESDDSWVPSCWSDRVRCDCQTARG